MKMGDMAGIVCCSDGIDPKGKEIVDKTEEILKQTGLRILESPYIYQKGALAAGTPGERADALMKMYRNPEVKAIFDISGGNLANQILEYLDFEMIAASKKEFWGYSDLTVVLNAIYAKTGKSSWLYQIRNLSGKYGEKQRERFENTVFGGSEDLFPKKWKYLQGEQMEGIVVGGNIRCFLKLAGTEYFPDMQDKLLFLESRSGGEGAMGTMMMQLRQMGVFRKIKGLLLGSFSELDRTQGTKAVEDIVADTIQDENLPIARNLLVGHGSDSYALRIGEKLIVK